MDIIQVHIFCSQDFHLAISYLGFPGGAVVKHPPAKQKAQETQIHPWVRKIPPEEDGNPLQYSCLENSVDRGV